MNFIYNSLNKFLDVLTPILLIPLIIKVFSEESFGVYTFVTSMYAILILILTWDSEIKGTRIVSKLKGKTRSLSVVIYNYVTLKFIISLTLVFILGGLSLVAVNEDAEGIIFGGLYLSSAFLFVVNFRWVLSGQFSFGYMLTVNILSKVFYLLSVAILFYLELLSDLHQIGTLFFLSQLIVSSLHIFKLNKVFGVKKLSSNFSFNLKLLSRGRDVFFANLVNSFYGQGNFLIYGMFFSLESLAVFSLNYKLPAMIVAFLVPVIHVLYPKLCQLKGENERLFFFIVFKVVFFIFIFSSFMSYIYYIFSERLIVDYFGGSYDNSLSITFVFSAIFTVLSVFLSYILYSLHREVDVRKGMFLSVLVNFLGCLSAVFFDSGFLYALGMLASQFVLMLFFTYLLFGAYSESKL